LALLFFFQIFLSSSIGRFYSVPGVKENEMINLETEFKAIADDCLNRLDILLSRKFPVLTRDLWQERIRSGNVLVNGLSVRASRRLRPGDTVVFRYSKKAEPSADRTLDILYEDDSIIMLNKRPGVPVHPSGAYFKNTVYFMLKEHYGEDFTAYFVHRLDRETSGLLLLAKSREYARSLQQAFSQRTVYKEYICFTEGVFPESLNADGYLTSDDTDPVRKKRKFITEVPHNAEYETSHTEFILKKVFKDKKNGDELSAVRCILHTGRMHQIRATLCSLGYPVIGDRLYGVNSEFYIKFIEDRETDEERKLLRMNRTALHNHILRFIHPATGKEVQFVSDLPADMNDFLSDSESD
jgi:RluA family pseudouridine synthase